MKRPDLDRLIDHCEPFRRALDDYQAVYATGDIKAAEKAWERCTAAARAFWAQQKPGGCDPAAEPGNGQGAIMRAGRAA